MSHDYSGVPTLRINLSEYPVTRALRDIELQKRAMLRERVFTVKQRHTQRA